MKFIRWKVTKKMSEYFKIFQNDSFRRETGYFELNILNFGFERWNIPLFDIYFSTPFIVSDTYKSHTRKV